MIIYSDLDNVAYPLYKHLSEIANREKHGTFNYLTARNYMLPHNDGFIGGTDYYNELLLRKGTFFDHEPEHGYVECMERLIKEKHDVRIITYPQWTSPHCAYEKVQWIRKFLPFFDLSNLFMARKKVEFARPDRILLDDNPYNLNAWKLNGGIGVSYAKIQYSYAWSGRKVIDFEEFYDLVQELSKPKEDRNDTDKGNKPTTK